VSFEDVQPSVELRSRKGLFDPPVREHGVRQEGKDTTTELPTEACLTFAELQLALESSLVAAVIFTFWVKSRVCLGQACLDHVGVLLLPSRIGFRLQS